VVSSDRVRWSTATNPLRWGMLLNFAFDAAAPPAAASATIGLFRPIAGRPDELPATTQGPSGLTPVCTGDVSGRGGVPDGHVDVDDLNALLSVFGTEVGQGSPADLAHDDGFVDVDDLNVVLGHWGDAC
ncbi:MAG: GC-type dockerin domain-anchored protein, partial [Phycisphaerales bacterium]